MKNINQYICESKEKEFHYATEGNHDFIDEVVNFIEANGFTKSNNKIIKKMEYSLLNNDYELNIRVKALSKSHPDTSTILVVIRKGDNCNYDYYEKYLMNHIGILYQIKKQHHLIYMQEIINILLMVI